MGRQLQFSCFPWFGPSIGKSLRPSSYRLSWLLLRYGAISSMPCFPQALAQRIRIVAAVGDHALGLLPRTAFRPGDVDFRERVFRKRNFCRRGTFQPNSQRNTFTVCQYHPLRSLAALGFTDREAPFLAGAKLPSKKVSSHRSSPSSFSPPSNERQASSQTPCSCHCCNRRQQVEGEGKSSGRNRHAAPVCRIHRTPSKHGRLGAAGRPRLSGRRLRFGNRGRSAPTACRSTASASSWQKLTSSPASHIST